VKNVRFSSMTQCAPGNNGAVQIGLHSSTAASWRRSKNVVLVPT